MISFFIDSFLLNLFSKQFDQTSWQHNFRQCQHSVGLKEWIHISRDICFAATKTFPKDKGFVKFTLNIQTSRHNTMKTVYTLQVTCETLRRGIKLRNEATNLINTVDTYRHCKLGPLSKYSLTFLLRLRGYKRKG